MHRYKCHLLLIGLALFACAVAALQTTSNSAAETPQPWSVEYMESGGIDGRALHVVLKSDGQVSSIFGVGGTLQSYFHASPEQLAEAQTLIDGLHLSGPPKPLPRKPDPPIPDMVHVNLSVTRGGQIYPVASPPARLVAILKALLAQGRKLAEDEKWAKAGPFKLGRVWHVHEEVRDSQGLWHGEQWEGDWTRQGDTGTFDAVWRNNKTKEEIRDTVEVESSERGRITLHRTNTKVHYDGWYQAEKQNDLTGYVTSCGGCSWRAKIEY